MTPQIGLLLESFDLDGSTQALHRRRDDVRPRCVQCQAPRPPFQPRDERELSHGCKEEEEAAVEHANQKRRRRRRFITWLRGASFLTLAEMLHVRARRSAALVSCLPRRTISSEEPVKSALLCRLVTDGGNQKVHTPTRVFLPAFMMAKNESRIKAFSHPKCVLSSQYLSKGSGAEG